MHIDNLKLEEIKESEESLVNFQNQLLGKQFRTVLGDIHYLHHVYGEKISNDENIDDVTEDWIEFSDQRRIYDQIRYIDTVGDEIIRINYDNGAWLVADDDLQNKKDRYYFYETIELDKEDVLVSPLDLNIEHGEIELPYKPMIRFSTPLHNDAGELQGVIVLNYLGKTVLDDFKEIAKTSNGTNALLNSDSYWLSCEDKDNEWNFMFEETEKQMFSNHYPEEWEIIKQEQGQILTDNGLFTFAPVHLNHTYTREDEYQVDDNIKYLDSTWYIVSVVGMDSAAASALVDSFAQKTFYLFQNNTNQLWLMVAISLVVGYLIYLNRKKYYEIKFYSEYDPLTQAFNRRAGLKKINNKINIKEDRRVFFSLCFIDVNGLKQVNDYLGHEVGDELLRTVSETIQSNIRDSDFLIRQGGDEFIIVFDRIGAGEAEKIWSRIVSRFDEVNENGDLLYRVSVSHGVVEYTNNIKADIDYLIQLADDKMYQEKEKMHKLGNVLKNNL